MAAATSSEPAPDAPDRACRICFDDSGELCSPCACRGDQEFVHDECLRRWQRTCPTAGQSWVCGVCRAPFAMPPKRPTTLRAKLAAALLGRNKHAFSAPPCLDLGVGTILVSRHRQDALPSGHDGCSPRYWRSSVIVLIEHEIGGAAKGLKLNHTPQELRRDLGVWSAEIASLCAAQHASVASVARGASVTARRPSGTARGAAAPALGGPCDAGEIYVLHTVGAVGGGRKLADGLIVGGALPELVEATGRAEPGTRVRVFGGSCDWGPMQLDGEIRRGSWAVVGADRAAPLVFATRLEDMWKAAAASAGLPVE